MMKKSMWWVIDIIAAFLLSFSLAIFGEQFLIRQWLMREYEEQLLANGVSPVLTATIQYYPYWIWVIPFVFALIFMRFHHASKV